MALLCLAEVDVVPVEDPPLPAAGAVGVKVAAGLDTQEVAAEFAADAEEGARGLTVPFPAKLQAWASRLLAS